MLRKLQKVQENYSVKVLGVKKMFIDLEDMEKCLGVQESYKVETIRKNQIFSNLENMEKCLEESIMWRETA